MVLDIFPDMHLQVCSTVGALGVGAPQWGSRRASAEGGPFRWGLQVPIAEGGHLLCGAGYVTTLVQIANEKMQRNWDRMRRLTDALCAGMLTLNPKPYICPASLPPPGSRSWVPGPPSPCAAQTVGPENQFGAVPTGLNGHVSRRSPGAPQGQLAGADVAAGRWEAGDCVARGSAFEVTGSLESGPEGVSVPTVPAVVVPRKEAKRVKDALKALSWLHSKARVSKRAQGPEHAALPLSEAGSAAVQAIRSGTLSCNALAAAPRSDGRQADKASDAQGAAENGAPAPQRAPENSAGPHHRSVGEGEGRCKGRVSRGEAAGVVRSESQAPPLVEEEGGATCSTDSCRHMLAVQEVVLAGGVSFVHLPVEGLASRGAAPHQTLRRVVASLLDQHGGPPPLPSPSVPSVPGSLTVLVTAPSLTLL